MNSEPSLSAEYVGGSGGMSGLWKKYEIVLRMGEWHMKIWNLLKCSAKRGRDEWEWCGMVSLTYCKRVVNITMYALVQIYANMTLKNGKMNGLEQSDFWSHLKSEILNLCRDHQYSDFIHWFLFLWSLPNTNSGSIVLQCVVTCGLLLHLICYIWF